MRSLTVLLALALLTTAAPPDPVVAQVVTESAVMRLVDRVEKPSWTELKSRPADFSGDTIAVPGFCLEQGPADLSDELPWLYESQTLAQAPPPRAGVASVILLVEADSVQVTCDTEGRALGLFRSQFRYLGSLELIAPFPISMGGEGGGS